MDSLIYFGLGSVSVLGILCGMLFFRKEWTLDAILFPLLSFFSSLILIFSSFYDKTLFTEIESKLMFAFFIFTFLVSFAQLLMIMLGTFGGVKNERI